MNDDEDGGEHTNREYYNHVWTKPIKVRTEPKKVKQKRHLKKIIHLCDVLICAVEDLGRSHHKREDSTIPPLFRG